MGTNAVSTLIRNQLLLLLSPRVLSGQQVSECFCFTAPFILLVDIGDIGDIGDWHSFFPDSVAASVPSPPRPSSGVTHWHDLLRRLWMVLL